MKAPRNRVNVFQGVDKNAAPQSLPPNLFQEDEGSDRYRRGSWKRRRGMRHTSLAKFDDAVVAMIGMDMPGSDYALLVVEGNKIHGFSNVTQQTDSSSSPGGSSGFGVGGFGEGGFGD